MATAKPMRGWLYYCAAITATEFAMLPVVANLFDADAETPGQEQFFALWQRPGLRLERIVSNGQCSPPGDWYDQADHEWVLLARGVAVLEFEAGDSIALKAGDHLLLPAGVRHRVGQCSDDAIWLALHVSDR